jgi:alpha-2-macroglobulin
MEKILEPLARAARSLLRRLVSVLTLLFGKLSWSPPVWLARLADIVAGFSRRTSTVLREARTRDPRRFWTGVAAVAVVLVGSIGTVQWYRHRPKPHVLTVSGTWPRPTKLEKDGKPDPLVLAFSGSAAALSLVGKEVTSGITASPPLDGKWQWRSDSSLVFTPKSDWEVGRKYTLRFDQKLFASHVLLSSYS